MSKAANYGLIILTRSNIERINKDFIWVSEVLSLLWKAWKITFISNFFSICSFFLLNLAKIWMYKVIFFIWIHYFNIIRWYFDWFGSFKSMFAKKNYPRMKNITYFLNSWTLGLLILKSHTLADQIHTLK